METVLVATRPPRLSRSIDSEALADAGELVLRNVRWVLNDNPSQALFNDDKKFR